MNEDVVEGTAWRFGTDIDTDVIVPTQYMRKEPDEYSHHVMEPIDPDFTEKITEGDVIIAEENFGIGSSREHAAIGLQQAGIGAVIAVSFGRIFYRNAINQGLPALRADLETVEQIEEGEQVRVDVFDGMIHPINRDEILHCERPAETVRQILKAGGAKAHYGDS